MSKGTKPIIWCFWPWSGMWSMGKGAGTSICYRSLEAMLDAGYEVHLFAKNDGLSRREESCEGIHIHRFNVPMGELIHSLQNFIGKVKPFRIINITVLQILYYLLYTSAEMQLGIREGKKRQPSLIYAFSTYDVLSVFLLSRRFNVPNITRLFGIWEGQLILKSPSQIIFKWQTALAFLIPSTYLIITDDGTQGDKVAQKFAVSAGRLRFWRNGVDINACSLDSNPELLLNKLGIPQSTKIVLTASRLDTWKRLDRVIGAVPYVASEIENVLFVILGDGNEKGNLEKLAHSLGVEKSVRFTGIIPNKTVPEFMKAADIFVSTNDLSNVSNGLLEAMSCGKCIVTLDTGDTKKLIQNNITGKLVPTGEEEKIVKGLADAIVNVLKDDKLRAKLGENARKYAEENFYSWEKRMNMELELIEEARKERKRG